MIKKRTDNYINKIAGCPSLYKMQKKLYFAELLNSWGEYYQCN